MKMYGFDIITNSNVYKPREDTFLLVDSLKSVINEEDKVLEIGCGTGLVSLVASDYCDNVCAVDINESAVNLAKENRDLNNVTNMEVLSSDMFQNVTGSYDLIIFNPPYLPGDTDYEKKFDGSEQWFGGESGREVLSNFLKDVSNHLNSDGRVLLLISSLTGFDEVVTMLDERGFKYEVLDESKVSWEKLYTILLQLDK